MAIRPLAQRLRASLQTNATLSEQPCSSQESPNRPFASVKPLFITGVVGPAIVRPGGRRAPKDVTAHLLYPLTNSTNSENEITA
ncbi:hypothetical protein EVAR_81347_1 [Eumeta japonica]|uniref:Uncharacterized protein n=1 Tax=Eumeta variegata TaxID=151549 RepID=A0A4C1XB62_EUMVA|nr:hypothetical protein EVAR_81347_1 [Eumeta japonica]